jgi:hypothetical protein
MTRDSQRGSILVVDDNVGVREFVKSFGGRWLHCDRSRRWRRGSPFLQRASVDYYARAHRCADAKMNGFVLADHLLAIKPQLRTLFMSGDAWCAYPGLKCVSKPFGATEPREWSRVLNVTTHSERTTASAA